MMPPRRRRTKWRVDSFWMLSANLSTHVSLCGNITWNARCDCEDGVSPSGGRGLRTNGVGRLHLEGDGLARNYSRGLVHNKPEEGFCNIRVFTKICMLSVLLDLVWS
jgi:hypothetical protein